MAITSIITGETFADDEKKAEILQEISKLIADNNLSWAEIKGALWEAGLILLHTPLEVKQDEI